MTSSPSPTSPPARAEGLCSSRSGAIERGVSSPTSRRRAPTYARKSRRFHPRIARETAAIAAPIAIGVTIARGSHLYNCAALVHRGRVRGFVPKEKLPTYNVFYEGRTFARGVPGLSEEVAGVPFGDLVFDLD